MSNTLLQTYLTNQFIKTDDDGNITHLKKAAVEVAKRQSVKKPTSKYSEKPNFQ